MPALPTSLQELKLNDNLLQGLQHSSFRGSGFGQPPGAGTKRARPEQPGRPWKVAGEGRVCPGQPGWKTKEGAPAWESGLGLHGSSSRKLPIGLQSFAVGSGAPLPTYPAGLSQLLTLEVEGNQLHDGNISPLAFQSLHNLLYLRLDRNRLRTIPPGLPASLQVSWETRVWEKQHCGPMTIVVQ